ncbi:MAG: M56 family metallopeptidase [Gemmatimonadaceae bacterium]
MTATWIAAWTLLHFVWQGTLVAAVLAIALAAMRRQRAHRRYLVSVLALGLMMALPVVTALRLASAVEPDGKPLLSPMRASTGDGREPDGVGSIPSAETAAAPNVATGEMMGPVSRTAERSAEPVAMVRERIRAWGDSMAPVLVVVWLSGVLLFSLRLLGGWRRVRRLTLDGTTLPSAMATARLKTIAAQLGVTRPVRLVASARVQVPAVIGWLRPVLLMPLSLETGLSTSELELLLAHELAHIRRHDYFVNVLQTIVETALFYHPAIWWVSRQIREEREHCCDDIAVEYCGDTKAYAEALVRLEHFRRPVPALAAAASGGNLVRRIRRLIDGGSTHADARTRWTALPLAAAALTGIVGGTRVHAESRPAPTAVVSVPAGEPQVATAQSRNARPDTVIRYSGAAASLGSRVEWATTEARRERRALYWIGYSIAADPDRGFIHINRHVPVVFSGGSVMTGSMRFTRAEGMVISGVPLDDLVGPRSPSETIVLFGFRNAGGRATLDRINLSSGMLPVHFDGRALYWLGDGADAESIALVRRLFGATPIRELKHDLITVTSTHLDAPAVFAALRSWLASNEPEETRAEAAEELAHVPVPAALALIARTARDDRSRQVRREAAEALGEIELPEAADTLVQLVGVLDDIDVAREAIEALGERPEPVAFDALVRIVWGDRSTELQREAVETMGETKDERRTVELERTALTHRSSQVRQEAVETLGEVDDATAAIRILRDVVDQDAVDDVRQEAVETLGELDDRRAFTILVELARNHRDVEVRKRAVAALAEHGRKDEVFDILREMIQDASSERVARAAVEALGDIDDARAVQLLESTATRHPSSAVQREAVSALGSVAPVDAAWQALERIAFRHPLEDVQQAAVEEFGNVDRDGVEAMLERVVTTHERSRVRITAVEALGNVHTARARAVLERMARDTRDEALQIAAIESYAESAASKDAVALLASLIRAGSRAVQEHALEELAGLEDNAGLDTIIEVARSHPDRELRRIAIEHLGESDDPRAHAELARLLRSKD